MGLLLCCCWGGEAAAASLATTALTAVAGVVPGERGCWLLPVSFLSMRLLACKEASGSRSAALPMLGCLTLTGCDDNCEGVRTGGGG